jgi:hypothetical protein
MNVADLRLTAAVRIVSTSTVVSADIDAVASQPGRTRQEDRCTGVCRGGHPYDATEHEAQGDEEGTQAHYYASLLQGTHPFQGARSVNTW